MFTFVYATIYLSFTSRNASLVLSGVNNPGNSTMWATLYTISQSSLLPEISEEVIDAPSITSIKRLFTEDAWMTLVQKGTYDKKILNDYNYEMIYETKFYFCTTVNIMTEIWKCHLCTTITTKQNMIACDFCNKWYHW